MKFGFRVPSLNKRITARTSVKRIVQNSLGLKAPRGWGWLTNPKKAAYNRVYNRTSFGCLVPIIVFVLITVGAIVAFAKEPIRTIEGTVTKVSDGDTIHVTDGYGTKVKVRFYGIDAPETEKSNKKTGRVSKPGQPFGEEAFNALRGKIFRKRVRLEITEIDKYKRSVAIVWLGNRNIKSGDDCRRLGMGIPRLSG